MRRAADAVGVRETGPFVSSPTRDPLPEILSTSVTGWLEWSGLVEAISVSLCISHPLLHAAWPPTVCFLQQPIRQFISLESVMNGGFSGTLLAGRMRRP